MVAHPLFRLLWLDEHQRFQHLPNAAERFLFTLKFRRRLAVLRRVLFRFNEIPLLRQALRDFSRQRVSLLPSVFVAQFELKADRENVRFDCRNPVRDLFAKIIPERAIAGGNGFRAERANFRQQIVEFVFALDDIAPGLERIRRGLAGREAALRFRIGCADAVEAGAQLAPGFIPAAALFIGNVAIAQRTRVDAASSHRKIRIASAAPTHTIAP